MAKKKPEHLDKFELARRKRDRQARRKIKNLENQIKLQRLGIARRASEDEALPPVLERPLPRYRQSEVDDFFDEYGSDGFVKRMDRCWSAAHGDRQPPRNADSDYVRALVGTFEQNFPRDPDGVYARVLVEVGQRDPEETEDVEDSP